MALNPIVFTEKVVRSFLHTAHGLSFSDEGLHGQMRASFPWTRPDNRLVERAVRQRFQAFRQGASVKN